MRPDDTTDSLSRKSDPVDVMIIRSESEQYFKWQMKWKAWIHF